MKPGSGVAAIGVDRWSGRFSRGGAAGWQQQQDRARHAPVVQVPRKRTACLPFSNAAADGGRQAQGPAAIGVRQAPPRHGRRKSRRHDPTCQRPWMNMGRPPVFAAMRTERKFSGSIVLSTRRQPAA
jgi:hypothetical protein